LLLAGCQTPFPRALEPLQPLEAAPSPSPTSTTLHLLTWEGYAPPALVERFERETGIDVEVTYARSAEDLANHLQAGSLGTSPGTSDLPAYDLATPLGSDLQVTQTQGSLYQPLDLAQIPHRWGILPPLAIKSRQFTQDPAPPAPGAAPLQYGIPAAWGTLGLVVQGDPMAPGAGDPPDSFQDLCVGNWPDGVLWPAQFPALMVAAYAQGRDPFGLMVKQPQNRQGWEELLQQSYGYLEQCQGNVAGLWQDPDEVADALYDGKVMAAVAWDHTGWLLQRLNPKVRFVVPQEGALGWFSVFALPAQADNRAAAYAWINFMYQPAIAAAFMEESGLLSPLRSAQAYLSPAQQQTFGSLYGVGVVSRVHWFPPRSPQWDALAQPYTVRWQRLIP